MIKIPKKGEYVKSKYFERNTKSPFMNYANFESILEPVHKGRRNPNES